MAVKEAEVKLNSEELRESAFDEGTEDALMEELAGKEQVTAEDLRRLPETEKYSDEELLKMWGEYSKGEKEEPIVPVFKPSFPIYDEKGEKIEDWSKIKLEDLLGGKIQIGYNANKQEQKKALNDLIRVAQLGHHNEQRYAGTIAERNQLAKELESGKVTIARYEKERSGWDSALVAALNGDVKPLQELVKAYGQELSKTPQVLPEGMLSREQVEQEQQNIANGMNFVNNVLIPEVQKVAESYGAKFEEVGQVARHFIEQEGDFLTREKLDAILQFDVPNYLESKGYRVKGQAAPVVQSTDEIAELKKTIAALQESVAEKHNTGISRLKSRKVPASGSGNTPPAGDTVPAMNSRQAMKDWLQS